MPAKSHSAAGTNAGFSYQFERALYWLAKSPAGAQIGIETDDDVAVRNTEVNILEQNKHSIRENAAPFGDRSKDLWNTLTIWLEAVEGGQVSIDSTKFLMVTNKNLSDCIAKRISAADSDEAAEICISELEKAGTNPPESISKYVGRVLHRDSRENLTRLIPLVELIDGTQASAGTALRADTIGYLQLPRSHVGEAESILDELHGWLHKTVLEAWQGGQSGWVQRDHFINQFHSILDRRIRQVQRERAENMIPVTDVSIGQEKGRPFVRQLHLVTDDGGMVDNAIRDFIRCNIEKVRLSKEGNITDEDWIAFESTLFSRWQRIHPRVKRMHSTSCEEDIGFQILTETTEDHRERLAGVETEQVYLTSGTYHRMADSLRVGWHPLYVALMNND